MVLESSLPLHIAIIMDGNGRWAQQRHLPRTFGHREGVKRVKDIVQAAADMGIGFLTLYAFSTENWTRPSREVGVLMKLLSSFLNAESRRIIRNNVRFRVIGKTDHIPGYILEKIHAIEKESASNSGLCLVLAINYGSREEIVDAAKRFACKAVAGGVEPGGLTPEMFSEYLYTAGIPDPDLLIRTSGEMRLSNFLLWQLSYTEFYFAKKFWPDFKKEDLAKAVKEYQKRERRFGRL